MTTVPTKEALVVILDIGLGMHKHHRSVGGGGISSSSSSLSSQSQHLLQSANNTSPIDEALKAATLLFQQKLIYGKKDELGLVLIGTKETNNSLQKDGYQHITTACNIEEPKVETLRFLESIQPGESRGDVIDSLIVAMDMLIHKTEKKKFQKRIFLVTNASDPINKDDLSILQQQFKNTDVKLNVVGVDFTDEEDLENKIQLTEKEKNEVFLRRFVQSVNGILVPVKQALEIMSFFRSQSVLSRTGFRGVLEISTEFGIPVWGYLRTKIQTLPTLKKVSTVAQQADNPASLEVKQEKLHYSITDPDKEILDHDLLKGYKYGKSIIPYSKIDIEALKLSASKCLKTLGFAPASHIPLHHLMGQTEVLVAPPGDQEAALALSGIIHALAETDQVIIVRFVKRSNCSPYLGYLYPHIKANYECLYFNPLPFIDDIRHYQFPPISPKNPQCKKQYQPTADQLNAAHSLIESMDLMTADEDDEGQPMPSLRPKYTYNPSLQHFFQCLHHRALHPKTPLPSLDPLISKYINPDENILERASDAIKDFHSKFTLTKVNNFKSDHKYRWKDGMLIEEEIKLDSYIGQDDDGSKKKRKADDLADYSLDKLVSGYVNEVGSINPVQNFKDMLARRDIDLVDKAINLMRSRIVQLVNDSLKDQFYQKALECVVALRQGCIKESESDAFNTFLQELRDYFESKKRDDFWQLLVTWKITLINDQESDTSSVSEEESKKFLGVKPKPVQPLQAPSNNKGDTVDDLFDQIE
ncbi:ATP-dependent DNA helicase [Cavenderia fasciculata]|uniref:ATP-dependent DNA helicase n=1 Tax=Cavenderia fasciculata TaxID=261658 RepID=F4PIU8_CACFS|nr:ATP-dependent DNA helicase [Cavenderia fasciculata]EGG24234.1 ATP-dependent DNA helicase [Cavenderia fasciculata]|eukprot:XP_004362085.1 ATP-dependent DNA helicase [Cavenderia fasciculata]